jgi:hypothetical protein
MPADIYFGYAATNTADTAIQSYDTLISGSAN